MKIFLGLLAGVVIWSGLFAQGGSAQGGGSQGGTAYSVKVSGEVTNPLTLTAADIGAMPRTNASAKDRPPFRLIVPGEKKPARSCMQVVGLVVKFAKD